jgi:hypothetical protein
MMLVILLSHIMIMFNVADTPYVSHFIDMFDVRSVKCGADSPPAGLILETEL